MDQAAYALGRTVASRTSPIFAGSIEFNELGKVNIVQAERVNDRVHVHRKAVRGQLNTPFDPVGYIPDEVMGVGYLAQANKI